MGMIYQDETRQCQECGAPYTWLQHDQRFAAERGYLPPKRCPACRQLRKQQRRDQEMTAEKSS